MKRENILFLEWRILRFCCDVTWHRAKKSMMPEGRCWRMTAATVLQQTLLIRLIIKCRIKRSELFDFLQISILKHIVCTSTTSNSQWALTSIYIFSKIISIEVLPSSASTKISVWSITWPHHHNIHRTAALVWMLRSPVLVNNLSNSGLGFVFVGMMSLRAARCRAASCQCVHVRTGALNWPFDETTRVS